MKNHTVTPQPDWVAPQQDAMRRAVSLFSGRWKLEILWLLHVRMHRFNELRRAIPQVTQHMLTTQLRELERDGLIRRTAYPEVPPRVEYELTEEVRGLQPVFDAILEWAGHASCGSAEKRNRGP